VSNGLVTPPPTALQHAFIATLGDTKQLLGAFLEVSGLGFEYDLQTWDEGGNNLFTWTWQGRVKPSQITLKSGVTNSTVLFDWAQGRGRLTGPQNLFLRFTTAGGNTIRTFNVAAAIPVRWTGPTADIGANQVATESLVVAHRGLLPS
jgi:phage tail-like protein